MKKRSLISILVAISGIAAVTSVSFVSFKENKRNSQIDEEIKAMQEEAQKIKSNNENLREKIAYFETPQFQEGIAKEKLNLQKPDEHVVIVKPSPSREEISGGAGNAGLPQDQISIPNYKKWWNQFFEY